MVHRINVIRCEDTRRRSSGAPSRPEMYDDHLIAYLGHLHASRGAVGPTIRPTWRRPAPTERPKRPVESDTDWWPNAGACAAHFRLTKSTVRSCCNGYIQHVRGRNWKPTALRYSPHKTREEWDAARRRGRELRERREAERSAAMLA